MGQLKDPTEGLMCNIVRSSLLSHYICLWQMLVKLLIVWWLTIFKVWLGSLWCTSKYCAMYSRFRQVLENEYKYSTLIIYEYWVLMSTDGKANYIAFYFDNVWYCYRMSNTGTSWTDLWPPTSSSLYRGSQSTNCCSRTYCPVVRRERARSRYVLDVAICIVLSHLLGEIN